MPMRSPCIELDHEWPCVSWETAPLEDPSHTQSMAVSSQWEVQHDADELMDFRASSGTVNQLHPWLDCCEGRVFHIEQQPKCLGINVKVTVVLCGVASVTLVIKIFF